MTLTNLWPEPSIETGEDWVAVSGSDAPVPSATRAYVGAQSLYCKRGAGAAVTYASDNGFQAYIPSGAGTYRLSLRQWIPTGVGGTSHGIRIAGAGTTLQDLTTALRDQWVEMTTTFVWDGAGALNLSARGDSAAAECYIDAIILTAGSDVVTYFDGDTEPTPRYRYGWSGTAHASSSVRYERSASVKVEIAFDSGYRTPAASRTWTDVSAYAERDDGIGITYGRQDEFAVTDANSCNFVLDNTDGPFTWGNASSPYYPNVLRGRPVRVSVDEPFTSTRFTGFVDGWPVQWPGGSDAYAVVPLQAMSRLARLGLAQKARSVIEQEFLLDAPTAYYTLGEPEGSTRANDSSGNQGVDLIGVRNPDVVVDSTEIVFGSATGPGTDGLTAARFVHVDAVSASKVLKRSSTAAGLAGFEFYFNATGATAATVAGLVMTTDGGSPVDAVGINASGQLRFSLNGVNTDTSYSVIDGQTRHVAVKEDGANVRLYVDGVLEATQAGSLSSHDTLWVGLYGILGTTDLTVSLAHVAFYDTTPPSATRILAHAEAGLTGFAGDTTDERFERYAEWAYIPADEVVSTASAITVDHIPSDDQGPLDLMRKVEVTEAGVLHDDRDGKLTLRNRDDRYGAVVAVTFDAEAQEIGVDYGPTVDGQNLYNVGDGKNLDGTVTAAYADEGSREEYGDHAYSVETASLDQNEPLHLITAIVNANSEPRPRVAAITVDLTALDTATMQAVAGLDVGSLIKLENLPDQSPGGTTATFFVEGYSETLGVGSWQITFNLSPSWPIDSVFILDSATHGVLNSDDSLLAL